MNIKTELIKKYIADYIKSDIEDFEINADEIADTVAIKALYEIGEIIRTANSDFEAIDEIVTVLEKYGIDTGGRNDF